LHERGLFRRLRCADMLTCRQCKDRVCPDMGSGGPGCEDFTSEAIEEEPTEWQPTLEDYGELEARYEDITEDLGRANARIAGFENAIAELVRWAQDERP